MKFRLSTSKILDISKVNLVSYFAKVPQRDPFLFFFYKKSNVMVIHVAYLYEKSLTGAQLLSGVSQRMIKLEDQMGTLASSMVAIMKKMDALVKERSSSPQRSKFNRSPQRNFQRSRSPSCSPSPDPRCFHCGETGHF